MSTLTSQKLWDEYEYICAMFIPWLLVFFSQTETRVFVREKFPDERLES